jgi:hypothetical protein
MKALVAAGLAVLLLSGCASSTKPATESVEESTPTTTSPDESQEVTKESAADLFARAKSDYDAGYEHSAKKLLEQLVFEYPEADEIAEATAIIDKVDAKSAIDAEKEKTAEDKAEAIKKANEDKVLAKLRKTVDEIEGYTWYYDKTTPEFDDTNNVHLYIAVTDTGTPLLRLRFRYTSDSWLFIEQYVFRVDDTKYTISPGFSGVNRDNKGGRVWEWYDFAPSSDDVDMIRAIITSDKTLLRYGGQQYHDDRTISREEKTAFANVLDGYEILGGK